MKENRFCKKRFQRLNEKKFKPKCFCVKTWNLVIERRKSYTKRVGPSIKAKIIL